MEYAYVHIKCHLKLVDQDAKRHAVSLTHCPLQDRKGNGNFPNANGMPVRVGSRSPSSGHIIGRDERARARASVTGPALAHT